MSNLKKSQHYVWRHYLKAWTNDESIWTYFKELKKIDKPGLKGVAQEKYFYKLCDFTNDEEYFLKTFIESLSPTEDLKKFNLDFLSIFTITNTLKKQLPNEILNAKDITEEIKKIEINLMEDARTTMEHLGTKLINYRSIEDLKTIYQDDYIYDAILFLCFQYFRTKSMKSAVLQRFKGGKYEQLMKKAWNVVTYALGTTVANNILLNPNLKFIFLENRTSSLFITSDQPVFNLLNKNVNENGEVKELELYYPLTPSYALKIHFNTTQVDQFEKQDVNNDVVCFLNKKVLENSDFYVFANGKQQLEILRQDDL